MRISLIGVLGMLVWSCGSDDAPNNAHDFLVAYRDARCADFDRCCPSVDAAAFVTVPPGAKAIVSKTTKQQCEQQFASGSTAGGVYDQAKAAECLRAIKAASATCESPGNHAVVLCQQALHGKKRAGEACSTQGFECDVPDDGSGVAGCSGQTGRCLVRKLSGHSGDACDLWATESSSSLACDDATFCNGNTCTGRLGEGESCSSGACAKGLSCEAAPSNGPPGSSPALCMQRAEGAACAEDGSCGYGFACDPKTCSCHAPRKAGASCSSDLECIGYCISGKCGGASSGPSLCELAPSITFRHGLDPSTTVCAGRPPPELTPEQAACKDSVPPSVSPECAACACSAGDSCPATVTACDADCWGLLQCIAQMCPDLAKMSMQNDFSCVTSNCNAFLKGAQAATAAGMCVSPCSEKCHSA